MNRPFYGEDVIAGTRATLVVMTFLILHSVGGRATVACPVCFAMPRSTLADRLQQSSDVLLVRYGKDDPFSFETRRVLRGAEPGQPIGLFVDSVTRRTLKQNPLTHVVLCRNDAGSKWQRVAVADPAMVNVIQKIIALEEDWKSIEGRRRRWQFFIPFFGHQDSQLFELAYLELGRAPYRTIRELSGFVDPQRLETILTRREYMDWRPLAILIMAQKATESQKQGIRESFDACQRFSLTTNLSAWATAFIEISGQSAVETIRKTYLQPSGRTSEEVRAVVDALLAQHATNRDLRLSIDHALGDASASYPEVLKQARQAREAWATSDVKIED